MKKIRNPYIGLEAEGYNCFACAPHNPYGLKMEFYEDGDDVVCYWTPRAEYQGWVQTLHGGIQATLSCGGEVCSSADITYYCFSEQKAREEFHFRNFELEE